MADLANYQPQGTWTQYVCPNCNCLTMVATPLGMETINSSDLMLTACPVCGFPLN